MGGNTRAHGHLLSQYTYCTIQPVMFYRFRRFRSGVAQVTDRLILHDLIYCLIHLQVQPWWIQRSGT